MRATELIERGDGLFSSKRPMDSLWQTMAENFYPERADFTVQRGAGDEFADNLMTGYPILIRRELGNNFASMLRPTAKPWFHMTTNRGYIDHQGRRWLEWATGVMRRAMYDRISKFVRATKEADHDFATFGQAAIQHSMNRRKDGLLYRTWHLRDCAWAENEEGTVDTFHRNWKPEARQLAKYFPKTLPDQVRKCLDKEPHKTIKCRHVMMPAEEFYGSDKMHNFVSVFVDIENNAILEETLQRRFEYVLPRWQTVSGSQYAYSPATVVGLPDARLIQAQTRVLLESGEKAVDPPMVAQEEQIRSDIALYAGGVTWVDAAYDERLGPVLRPVNQDRSGVPIGMEMVTDVRQQIMNAFFLNKLSLPAPDKEMTAFEVARRVEEYIRGALPLFEPMESEYNGTLCELTFEILMDNGGFGSVSDIPDSLSGADIQFRFESPLHQSDENLKGQYFIQMKQFLREAAEVDPAAAENIDIHRAFRDATLGTGAPADWLRDEKVVAERVREQREAEEANAMMEKMSQASAAMKDAGAAQASAAKAGPVG